MADRRKAPDLAVRSGLVLGDVVHLVEEAALRLSSPDRDDAGVDAALERLGQARVLLGRLALEGAVVRPSQPGGATPTTPALVRRVQLPATSEAAHAARDFCRETCRGWSLPSTAATAVRDVASELVANASRYGTGPVVLALELTPDHLVVSVWDDGPGTPKMLPYRPGVSEHGVGLQLVNSLSNRWGWVEEQTGKWVWARIDLPARARLPRPRAVREVGRVRDR